ncbi:tautomerase family protein [Spirillospora sp. CA-294931]|uniref:tautomerase family protein n=1 Tax=Spirillospora sp. CA-294931 TaxID=3240042 RepID=UPI003D94993A
MPQIKFYGRRDVWAGRRAELSDLAHGCLTEAWQTPEDARFQRFLLLDPEDLVASGRSENYLIVEVLAFSGRSDDAKRSLIKTMYGRLPEALGISPVDLEIVVVESPPVAWGIRGVPGDEIALSYSVDI